MKEIHCKLKLVTERDLDLVLLANIWDQVEEEVVAEEGLETDHQEDLMIEEMEEEEVLIDMEVEVVEEGEEEEVIEEEILEEIEEISEEIEIIIEIVEEIIEISEEKEIVTEMTEMEEEVIEIITEDLITEKANTNFDIQFIQILLKTLHQNFSFIAKFFKIYNIIFFQQNQTFELATKL